MDHLNEYERLLVQIRNGCISIRQAVNLNRDCKIYCIYGLIESVQDSSYNNVAVGKVISLHDPSTDHRLSVHVYGSSMFFEIGNIARIQEIDHSPSSEHSFTAWKKNVKVIETFIYDYGNISSGQFSNLEERKICKYLETWYAQKLIFESENISINSHSKTYANLIGQLVRLDFLKQSIVVTIWDSRERKIKCYNPKNDAKGLQKTDDDSSLSNSELLYEYSLVNPETIVFAYKKSLIINVWKNESDLDNYHYDVLKSHSFDDGKDIIILFNVEIICKEDKKVAMTLRSGKHHGKGVKLVHRKSILGQKLLHQLVQRKKEFYQKYQAVNQIMPQTLDLIQK